MEVGIIVDNLGWSQESYLVLGSAASIAKNINHSMTIFQKEISIPILNPMCSVLNISEIFSFKGLLITTTLENLRLAKQVSKQSKLIYYPMDLEWLRKEKNFINNISTLKNIDIIAQNKYYANAILKYSNQKPVFNVGNLDIQKIIELYNDRK